MCTAAFALTNDVVALCHEVRRGMEFKVTKCFAESHHEFLHLFPATTGPMQ